MRCFDTSALIDYLKGKEAVGAYINDHENEPLFAPSVALYETFVGAARLRGSDGVTAVQDDLSWVVELELSAAGAAEAALVEAELRDAGTPIGSLDTLIAGMVREAGGTVVTGDDHFERVAGLGVERY
jgi:predicted nucleic acid-binding protein